LLISQSHEQMGRNDRFHAILFLYPVHVFETSNVSLELLTLNCVDAIIAMPTSVSSPDLPSGKSQQDVLQQEESSPQTSCESSPQTNEGNHQSELLEEEDTEQIYTETTTDLWSEVLETEWQGFLRKMAISRSKLRTFPTSTIPRNIFTDGMNSFWHFVFGMFAVKFPLLVSIFILYQILDRHDINLCIDILEFLLGFTITYFLLKV